LAGRSLQKLSRQSKVNLRADKITAVPFVPDTFSVFNLRADKITAVPFVPDTFSTFTTSKFLPKGLCFFPAEAEV
jgi:hypothetical protein